MHPDLSFDQAPPISVPYRFFLTAPWFGVAAGLLLIWAGDDAVISRWTSAALALTHLLAVGFMLQAMVGAMLQFVPVAAGGNVWRPNLVAGLAHPLLILASIVLVVGFLSSNGLLFQFSAALFVPVVVLLVVVVGMALLRTPAQGNTIWALRAAVVALAVTVLLGATMAEAIGRGRPWPLVEFANVHAAWGLGGWSLLMLSGVSYYVVPMFQLTPAYPTGFARWLPPALLAVLAVWSLQLTGSSPDWQQWVWLAGLALAAAFAAITLGLQQRRRRRIADPTMLFFRGAMICLLAVLVSGGAMTAFPALAENPRSPYWLGVLILPGVFVSAINGMLYKIVPFLNWLHLQRAMGLGMLPPNMKEMIPDRAMSVQMRLHFAAVGLLLAAALWPSLARLGGGVFAASCALLGWNLIGAVRVYRRFKGRIRVDEAGRVR
jgi:hypothetical protein